MATHTSFKSLEASLKKDIEVSARSQIQARIRKAQPILDAVLAQHRGEPVEAVIPHMRVALKRTAFFENELQVREWAQSVTDGDRRVLRLSNKAFKW
jgi:hypothetical protein